MILLHKKSSKFKKNSIFMPTEKNTPYRMKLLGPNGYKKKYYLSLFCALLAETIIRYPIITGP